MNARADLAGERGTAARGPMVLVVACAVVHLAAAAWLVHHAFTALHDVLAAHPGAGTPKLEPPLRRFILVAALLPPVAAALTGLVVWATRRAWWRQPARSVAWALAAGGVPLALDAVARALASARAPNGVLGDVIGRVTTSPFDAARLAARWPAAPTGDSALGVNAAAVAAACCWALALAHGARRPRWWTTVGAAVAVGVVHVAAIVIVQVSAPAVVPRLLRLLT